MKVNYSESKNEFNQWQMKITITITKALEKYAEKLLEDVTNNVTEKLEQVHKENIIASYSPRAGNEVNTYTHTNTLINAVYGVSEKKSKYERRAVIKVRPDLYPENHPRKDTVTAVKVYKWLRDGTKGGGNYWFENEEGEYPIAYNYSTPVHLFEEHTRLQIKGYLETLDIKKIAKNGRYKIK